MAYNIMTRHSKFLTIAFFHIVLFFLLCHFFSDGYLLGGHFICCCMSFCIWCVLLVQKHFFIFEPIILFSGYNYFIVLSFYYLVFGGIETNVFIQNYTFTAPFNQVLLKVCLLNLFGYLFCLLGYYSIDSRKKKGDIVCAGFDDSVYVDIFIIVGVLIGLSNFLYNNFYLADNPFKNPVAFLSNIDIINKSGTTIGYNFFIWAFLFYTLKDKKKKVLFVFFFLATIFLKITTGRIFQSIVLIVHIFALRYFSSKITKKKNKLYVFLLVSTLPLGVLAYAVRYYLSLRLGGMDVSNFVMNFFEDFLFFVFDKGNVPSMAIQTIVIDGWRDDIGFMLGRSFVYPIFNLLPSELRNINFMPAYLIKQSWFLDVQGGNLPATGVGELYVNFGISGVLLGMFIFGLFGKYLLNNILTNKTSMAVLLSVIITNSFYSLFPKGEINNFPLFEIVSLFIIYKFLSFFARYTRK